jgi:hypothetical protein
MNRFVLVSVQPKEDAPYSWPPRIEPSLDVERLIGALAWRRLPMPIRQRFAAGHCDVRYQGHIDLDCSVAGRGFALLARLVGGPLTSMRASGLAATVAVSNDARGGVVWERRFTSSAGARQKLVRSTKLMGPNGRLIEQTDGGLAMELDVFEERGALVFQSRRYLFRAGPLCFPIPSLLTPGVCRVEHHELGGGCFRFTLKMTHPMWGVTFIQNGVFHDPKEIAS